MNTDIRRSIFVVLMSSEVRDSPFTISASVVKIFSRIMSTPVNDYRNLNSQKSNKERSSGSFCIVAATCVSVSAFDPTVNSRAQFSP